MIEIILLHLKNKINDIDFNENNTPTIVVCICDENY